jgi:hypothetical protein
MSKSNFKTQLRDRVTRLHHDRRPIQITSKAAYIPPTITQLTSFAVIYIQSATSIGLSDLQKTIIEESLKDDPDTLRVWMLRHYQFQEELWRDGSDENEK